MNTCCTVESSDNHKSVQEIEDLLMGLVVEERMGIFILLNIDLELAIFVITLGRQNETQDCEPN